MTHEPPTEACTRCGALQYHLHHLTVYYKHDEDRHALCQDCELYACDLRELMGANHKTIEHHWRLFSRLLKRPFPPPHVRANGEA